MCHQYYWTLWSMWNFYRSSFSWHSYLFLLVSKRWFKKLIWNYLIFCFKWNIHAFPINLGLYCFWQSTDQSRVCSTNLTLRFSFMIYEHILSNLLDLWINSFSVTVLRVTTCLIQMLNEMPDQMSPFYCFYFIIENRICFALRNWYFVHWVLSRTINFEALWFNTTFHNDVHWFIEWLNEKLDQFVVILSKIGIRVETRINESIDEIYFPNPFLTAIVVSKNKLSQSRATILHEIRICIKKIFFLLANLTRRECINPLKMFGESI